MKVLVFLSFIFVGLAFSNEMYGQNVLISLNVKNQTISEVLEKIEKQSNFFFFYNNKEIDVNRIISIDVENKRLSDVLDIIFSDSKIQYSLLDNSIILTNKEIVMPTQGKAQNIPISGVVADIDGITIPGANIMIKGTSQGTVTNLDGEYSLTVPDENATLVFSSMGFASQEIQVGNQRSISVKLSEESRQIEEVVITALGIKREQKAVGYAVQNLAGDNIQSVKGADLGTSLTGKISGLNVLNSTEFGQEPTILLRGEEPLLVIDGVPYFFTTLREISADDVENITVLKGSTASALYGSRGQNGAIMVTTKKGADKTGFSVSINSSSMFTAGYLAIPELQSQYGRVVRQYPNGTLEYVRSGDGSWGPPLEGQIVTQWDPFTKSMQPMPYIARGKNNFKNFLEQGYILNNNVSIAQKGEYGNIRASLTWMNNKGNYPNSVFNKYIYSLGGDIKFNKVSFSSGITYNKQMSPNLGFNGYTGYDPMYSLLIWSSPDWDIRDYKDYWVIPNEVQNSSYISDNNNPYFDRYERTHSFNKDIFNGSFEIKYEPSKHINSLVRIGYDMYSNYQDIKISKGSFVGGGSSTVILGGTETWGESQRGSYNVGIGRGYGINGDFITSANYNFGDFVVDGFVGGSIMFSQDQGLEAHTIGGLSVPGFYSLKASVNPASVDSRIYKKQTNSLYGRLGFSWRSLAFIELTLRNDWVSTLPETTRSYLYPSVSGSFLISELLPKTGWLSLWKLRASWVTSKNPADIYAINSVLTIMNNSWGTLSSASVPTTIRGTDIYPESTESFEIGTAINILKNLLSVDVAYYEKKAFDFIRNASISPSSGYLTNFVNTDEIITRKGVEVTINSTPVETKDFRWNLSFNWTKYADYFTKLDPDYSLDRPWVKVGERADAYVYKDYLRDPDGNLIHNAGGLLVYSDYDSKYGNYGPDWIWGFSNNFKYKNWQLAISFDGRVGGLMSTTTEMYMWRVGSHPKSCTLARYLDATQPGTRNYIGEGVKIVSGTVEYDTYGNIIPGSDTRVFAKNDIATTYENYMGSLHRGTAWGGYASSVDIYSGTFLKLREISLTYNVPKSFCSKIKAEQLSISAIGQNVLFWAKDFVYSDPDGGIENFSDPSQRFLGFNVRINF